MNRHPACVCLIALWLGASAVMAQAASPSPATAAASSPQVAEQLRIASQKLEQGKTGEAGAAFEAADRLAGGQSCSALIGLAAVQIKTEKPKQAKETAKRALALGPNSSQRAAVLHLLGLATFQSADGKADELREAIAVLEEAIGLRGTSLNSSKLTLAHARNALGESQAAALELRELLGSLPATDNTAKESRILLCQIRHRHPEIPPASSNSPLHKAEGEVQRPENLFTPSPDYPISFGMAAPKPRGSVVIKGIVDQEGCVVEPKVAQSDAKELEFAALEKVSEWTFLPATLNGAAVSVYYEVTVNFSYGDSHKPTRPTGASRKG